MTGPVRLLVLSGRSGVGKSTTGWAISTALTASSVTHAFIEGDFLDAYHLASGEDPGSGAVTERNLRALWRNYRELGIDRLVYANTVGILEVEMLSRAIGGHVETTGVLLTSTDATARERLTRREHGAELHAHIERSGRMARELDSRAAASVHRVPTDDRTVVDIAAEVVATWIPALVD